MHGRLGFNLVFVELLIEVVTVKSMKHSSFLRLKCCFFGNGECMLESF